MVGRPSFSLISRKSFGSRVPIALSALSSSLTEPMLDSLPQLTLWLNQLLNTTHHPFFPPWTSLYLDFGLVLLLPQSLRNLQQELTVKQKLRKYLAVSTVGLGLDLMNRILSISSVIVYVAETYRDIAAVAGTMFMNFELVTSLFFLVDLL